MTSSTSGSEPGASWWAALPIVALLATVGGLYAAPVPTTGQPDAEIQQALAGPVDLLVVGNSVARAGVDLDALNSALPGPRSALVALDGTFAGHWYLVVRDHVFARGHQPAVVVFYADHGSFTATRELDDLARQMYFELAGDGDPLVVDRVYGGSRQALARARVLGTRARLRDRLVDGVVHGAVALAYRRPLDEGPLLVQDAARRLMWDPGEGEAGGLLPRPVARGDGTRRVAPPALFVAELAQVAREGGARPVFVLAPARQGGDCHEDLQLREAVDAVEAELLDLRCAPLPEACFSDEFHVAQACQQRSTQLLAEELLERGVPAPSGETPR